MKNKYLVAVLLVCFFFNAKAQFMDDMEYPTGIPASSNWWDCTTGCPLIVGPNAGHNSDYAGLIPDDGTTNAVLDLGNKIFGTWWLHFYLFIPSDQEASFNLQGDVPVTTGESIVGDFVFNPLLTTPGQGYIDAGTVDTADDTYFDFPHDEWFRIVMAVDINSGIGAATWYLWVNNINIVGPGTPFTDGNGNYPSHLGGVNFFSGSADNKYYVDDIIFFFDFVAGIEHNSDLNFSIFPNPAQDDLNIVFEEEVSEIKIYDLNGRVLAEGVSEKKVDVSKLASGVYFIELSSSHGKAVQKFIKE